MRETRTRERLSPQAMELWTAISEGSDEAGEIYILRSMAARLCKCKSHEVIDAVDELCRAGYITFDGYVRTLQGWWIKVRLVVRARNIDELLRAGVGGHDR